MRRITALILLVLVLLAGPVTAYSSESDQPNGTAVTNEDQGEQIVDEGGTFERIVAALVEFPIRIVESIGSAAKLQPLDRLVFLSEVSEDEKRIAPWEPSEIEFIKLWYAAMLGLSMPLYIIAIAVSGFKITMSGANPGMREEAINSIWRWFGAVVIVLLAPFLVQTLLQITAIILDGIHYGFGIVTETAGIGRSVSDWGGINFGGVSLTTGSVLGTAIVKVMFAFIWLWFNAIYIVRMLVLSVMICFTPIMALLWTLNKNVNAVGVWLGELASNAFMPVAHALVLCVILGFLDVKNVSDGTWFHILIALYTIMPLAEVIRNSMQGLLTRLSGINEEATAGKALIAAAGFGGVLSLGRVARATMGGGSKIDSAFKEDMPTGTSGWGSLAPIPVNSGRQIGFTSPDISRGQQPIGYSTGLGVPLASDGTDGNGYNIVTPAASSGGATQSTGLNGTSVNYLGGNSVNTPPENISTRGNGYHVPPIGSDLGIGSGPVGQKTTTSRSERAEETRPMTAAVKAGGLAGNVTRYTGGTLVNMVGGAIPGGWLISSSISRGMEMASRGIATAGTLGYKTFIGSKEKGQGFGQTLKGITGADSTLKAIGRGVTLAAKAAFTPEEGMRQARAYTAKAPGGLDGGRYR